jgi:hypothetical protein
MEIPTLVSLPTPLLLLVMVVIILLMVGSSEISLAESLSWLGREMVVVVEGTLPIIGEDVEMIIDVGMTIVVVTTATDAVEEMKEEGVDDIMIVIEMTVVSVQHRICDSDPMRKNVTGLMIDVVVDVPVVVDLTLSLHPNNLLRMRHVPYSKV